MFLNKIRLKIEEIGIKSGDECMSEDKKETLL